MGGIEGICGSGPDDGVGAPTGELLPELANATGMRFRGYDNHRRAILARELRVDGPNFVGGVVDWRLKDDNHTCGHAFVDQDTRVEYVFAGVIDIHGSESSIGLRWMREPHLRGVAFAIQLDSADGADRHSAAKHNDGVGLLERIFHDQPAPNTKENKDQQRH